MEKKCLACENLINKLNHYVCSNCYEQIKTLKEDLITFDEKKLKNEFNRWKRNLYLTKDNKYKNEYQKKLIAIAETINDKYKNSKFVNQIIDYSNNQKQIEKEEIKINEEEIEELHNIESKDKDVDLKNYNTWIKCKDGHRVISKSEKIIDDFLHDNKIRHGYDMEIDNNTNYRYDFKLFDYGDVYIEHWGFKDRKNYKERKQLKTEYYKTNNYILIESDEDSIRNPNYLKEALRKAIPDIFKKNKEH